MDWIKQKIDDSSCQCCFCGHWNDEHHESCPKDDKEMIEIWQAGIDAAKDGSNCYAEVGSVFWLGWMMQQIIF